MTHCQEMQKFSLKMNRKMDICLVYINNIDKKWLFFQKLQRKEFIMENQVKRNKKIIR